MASDVSSAPINGNYAPHQGYGGLEKQQNNFGYDTNHTNAHSAAQPTSSSTAANATTSPANQSEVPKDEVGWYFVEQYYTTLSRNPEKLYLLYNKRSQFVSGQETDKVPVCVGQRAINDRIKELDFHETKVRVTNVDSQASDSNIVIQVIGDISNKSQPHRRFTQTFVLATQTNGYFVLNDIFRYLIEEEDEPEPEPEAEAETNEEETAHVAAAAESGSQEPPPPPAVSEVEPKTLTSSIDPAAVENDAKQVDKELEDKVLKPPPKAEEAAQPSVNGVSAAESETKPAEEVAAAVPAAQEEQTTSEGDRPQTQESELEPEKPQAPEPTPAASPPPTDDAPLPAPAAKPAAPKTWASLAASANTRVATPAAPSATPAAAAPGSSTSQSRPTPVPAKATTPVTPTSATPSATTAPALQRDESAADGPADEWTAVGSSHNRQQSRQVNTQPPQQQQDGNRGYIKNVHEGIDGNELRTLLEQSGEVIYFDIARQKNCAFVDFKSVDGFTAAVQNNPHVVNGERLYVEERRFRPGSTPYVPRAQYQGGRGGGRGGGGPGTPRGGFQGRGGYVPRGARGGGGSQSAPRGRGGGSSMAA